MGELMMIEWKEKRRIPNITSCVWELIMLEGVNKRVRRLDKEYPTYKIRGSRALKYCIDNVLVKCTSTHM